ncbi:PHP domain-containing protein [Facklamia miroungae]|uniref:Histidinol-phosphatase n=1 Tax=Facklamia miroungae TaxID=120956 RepID=A0A1G7QA74_9LACT|nr:PHP domain-containing protein [Facklamia miroungae]NKZ28875.1 histidinol phosphate phosphatase [Facklamia miroungae]SDF95358.1 histidinol-phosphatase (PHP family) [Facklamia miroungae]
MKYFDQHMHTHFSYDSKEQLENYAKKTEGYLITTEHLDFKNPFINYQDNIPDYQQQSIEIEKLKVEYGDRFLRGVEVGYHPDDHDQIIAYINQHAFDLLVLSFHKDGPNEFMDENILQIYHLEKLMQEYFTLMLEGIKAFKQANILAHFDYGLRMFDVTIDQLAKHEDQLCLIFQEMIKNDMALELNSKSMYRYGNKHLYEYVIPVYQSVGGQLFSLGSDSHVASDLGLHFDESVALLHQFGVKELAVYIKQILHKVPLENPYSLI